MIVIVMMVADEHDVDDSEDDDDAGDHAASNDHQDAGAAMAVFAIVHCACVVLEAAADVCFCPCRRPCSFAVELTAAVTVGNDAGRSDNVIWKICCSIGSWARVFFAPLAPTRARKATVVRLPPTSQHYGFFCVTNADRTCLQTSRNYPGSVQFLPAAQW